MSQSFEQPSASSGCSNAPGRYGPEAFLPSSSMPSFHISICLSHILLVKQTCLGCFQTLEFDAFISYSILISCQSSHPASRSLIPSVRASASRTDPAPNSKCQYVCTVPWYSNICTLSPGPRLLPSNPRTIKFPFFVHNIYQISHLFPNNPPSYHTSIVSQRVPTLF